VALSAGYVLRETGGNLRRNIFMTLAAVVTMFVSLIAVGSVLVLRQGINQASVQWRGGVELAIFMHPSASQTEISAIAQELKTTPGVKRFHFVDKPEAYKEYRELFGNNKTLLNALTVNQMPTSFRVVPTNAADVSQLATQFQNQPGVDQVSDAQQEIDTLLKQFHTWRLAGTILAVVVLGVAVTLIVNTIQLAIFARRREVAVMKLVGATNWFIRIPFMLEGFLQGVGGAVAALVFVYFARNAIVSLLPDQTILGTNGVYVQAQQALVSGLVLLGIGAVVGMVGSAFAVRRYLSV